MKNQLPKKIKYIGNNFINLTLFNKGSTETIHQYL